MYGESCRKLKTSYVGTHISNSVKNRFIKKIIEYKKIVERTLFIIYKLSIELIYIVLTNIYGTVLLHTILLLY